MRLIRSAALVTAMILGSAAGAAAQSADSAAVAATVAGFHQALARGDRAAALALLADDIIILESGDTETRDEYRSHHLGADIAFAQAVASERGDVRVVVRGDAAWVTATSSTRGTFQNRPVDAVGAELMVLTRTASGWAIRAIHWSSHRRQAR